MSAAGRGFDLSPAVVSKRISHLETRLGTRLFHRTTRQLQLTETGRGFYERVIQILATVQEAEAFVSSGHERAGGSLKITAPTGFSRMHIAPYLGKFLKQYPDLSIEIIATDNILDIVREGIDVAIRLSELDDSSMSRKKTGRHAGVFSQLRSISRSTERQALEDLSKHKIIVKQHHLASSRPRGHNLAQAFGRDQNKQQRDRPSGALGGLRNSSAPDLANP